MKKHDIVQHDMKWLDVDVHEIDTRSMATPTDDPDELDHLDASLVIWAREIPDLDPLTEGIVERIQMLAHGFDDSAAVQRWPSSDWTGERSRCSGGCAGSDRRTADRPASWPTTSTSRAAP